MRQFAVIVGMLIVLAVGTGCPSSQKQLESVAKDWCMTIRASQVLPIYPLQEDVQPGDVFLVPTPISTQVAEYRNKGFLPLDQHVKRLSDFSYADFYGDAYWSGVYAAAPHGRPGHNPVPGTAGRVMAPRAAFPSYTFTVDKGGGLRLAIPIQGVPVGLGLMGASSARGSVQISDAYAYGIDMDPLYTAFVNWYQGNPAIQQTLMRLSNASNKEVYLRVVSRVFLASTVTVELQNLDVGSAGADAGAPQAISLPDLRGSDPDKLKAGAEAYRAALDAINGPLNTISNNLPGGSVRIAFASSRSVAMKETFDRPLVIGYHGFDVKVFKDGTLSAPIPSFAVLEAASSFSDGQAPIPWSPSTDGLDESYRGWLKQKGNFERMQQWLSEKDPALHPSDLYHNANQRQRLLEAAKHFQFMPTGPDKESPKPPK